MKKIYSSLLAIFLLANLSIGQLQNLGLETWSQGSGYETPDGWFDINGLVTQAQVTPVVEKVSVDPAQGQFAASVTTRFCALCGLLGVPIDTIPGILRQEASVEGKPESMTFKYKFAPVSGDYAGVRIEVTKWDFMLESAELLGEGFMEISTATSTWETGFVWIDYTSSDMPDSVKITFITSPRILTQDESFPPAQVGTKLTVDDISVSTPVSITENEQLVFNAFMANNVLTIQADYFVGGVYEIVGINGQVMQQGRVNADRMELPVDELSAGMYLIRMTKEGASHAVKFVK
jgi:hypothetical protein